MARLRSVLGYLMAIFLAGAVVSTLQERPLEPAVGVEEFVHAERRAQQLPGLAAVVVRSDGTPRVYVSGERRIGKGDLLTTADRMHIGSLTKSITATLIGAHDAEDTASFHARTLKWQEAGLIADEALGLMIKGLPNPRAK